jgi:hypothetical protein
MQTATIYLNRQEKIRIYYWFDRKDQTWNASIDEDDAPIGTGPTMEKAKLDLLRQDLSPYAEETRH